MSELIILNKRSLDQMWDEVKDHYERTYRIRFKQKLSDRDIVDFWKKIRILDAELRQHEDRKTN